MRKNIFILCLMLAFAGCQPAPQEPTTEKITSGQKDASKKIFAQAMLQLHQGDLKGALISLEQSIRLDPTDPNPYLVMGQILLKAEQYDKASEFLDQAAKNFPDNGTVFYMLSVSNKMSGRILPAVLAARRSFEIFKASGDVENAKTSAILLEDLIKSAQEEQKQKEQKDSKAKSTVKQEKR